MYSKIKNLLHVAAVIAIFFFTDSFCQEVTGRLFRICNSVIFVAVLYICIDILNVWIAILLYSKYILKMSFSKMYLGKPLPDLRWCAAAGMIFVTIDVFYFIFTKGEFKTGCFAQSELSYMLFHDIFSSGFRAAVTEGMLFRGMLFRILENEYGKRRAIFISGFFYASAGFIMNFAWLGEDSFWAFILMFLMGVALGFVTCETGSIWSSVVVHVLYTFFSGNEFILQIVFLTVIIMAAAILEYRRKANAKHF